MQQGEARYDVTLRYLPQYRDTREAIENIRLLAPSGERVSLAQLTKVSTDDGAEEIYREGGQRYIAIKYCVRGRDLGSTVEEAIGKVNPQRESAAGYHLEWAGEYRQPAARQPPHGHRRSHYRAAIFLILYTMFRSFKWAMLILVTVVMASHRRPAGAVHHPHQLLRFVGGRLPRALRRFGAKSASS